MTQIDSSTAADGSGASRAAGTARLMDKLASCGGDDAKQVIDQIVELNMDVAQTLARRYYGHGERSDDLDQCAYLGLIKAVHRFDPGRGRDFLAFAVPTILGELRRHFRDGCWMVRPPRRIQELQGRMAPAVETFLQEHGRSPEPAEIAALLDAALDDVIEAMSAGGCFTPTSLDMPLGPASATALGDMVGQPDGGYEQIETHESLKPLIERLSPRDHRVLELRFFWDWTQAQIAEEIGVTQMQVSRILARIMTQLRGELTDAPTAA